jgi:hypothetical protein
MVYALVRNRFPLNSRYLYGLDCYFVIAVSLVEYTGLGNCRIDSLVLMAGEQRGYDLLFLRDKKRNFNNFTMEDSARHRSLF